MTNNKKKIIINIIIIIIVLFFTFFYLFKSDILTIESLKGIKIYQVLIVLFAFLIAQVLYSMANYFVYKKINNKMNVGRLIINESIGHLGSSISPFRSLHFPLKLYYQNTIGVKLEDTLTAISKAQIIYSFTSMISYFIITIILMITKYQIVFMESSVSLFYVVGVGFLFHLFIFFSILILSFNIKLQKKFINLLAKVMNKFKKDFNKEEYIISLENKFLRYRGSIKDLFKNIKYYLIVIVFYIAHKVTLAILEYIAYLAFTLNPFDFNELIIFYILNLAMVYIANVVPLPGGFGTTEVLFVLVFASVIDSSIIGSILLVYRMGTYYIPVILEAILFIIISSKYNKRIIKENKETDKLIS